MSSASTSNRLISTGRSSCESRLASNASVLSPASRARSISTAVVSAPLMSPSTGTGKGKGLRNNPMITLLSSRRAISATAARRTSSEIPPSSQTITSLIIATSWLDDKCRDGTLWTAPPMRPQRASVRSKYCRAVLHQQIEDTEALLPVLGCRVLQIAIDDLESARKRHAQAAHHLRRSALGIFAIGKVERRRCGELIENRL